MHHQSFQEVGLYRSDMPAHVPVVDRARAKAPGKENGAFDTSSIPLISSSNHLIQSLSGRLFDLLRPALRTVKLKSEQYVFHQDDAVEYIYFPESAVISEFKILIDGRMVEVAIAGRDSAVGLPTLVSRSTRANCTQVVQSGSATRILFSDFVRLTKGHRDLDRIMDAYLNRYFRQLTQKAICNMFHSVEERLCTWLLTLEDRCGRGKLILTHEQIARAIGVHRPSISRIARVLKKNALIGYSRGNLSIRDRQRMEEFACACYQDLRSAAISHEFMPADWKEVG